MTAFAALPPCELLFAACWRRSQIAASEHKLRLDAARRKPCVPLSHVPALRAQVVPVEDTRDDKNALTPPLEHCIRTRWPGARVEWNGSEQIL